MDLKEYRIRGKEMVDYIADYLSTISTRRVLPSVKPGYLSSFISSSPPTSPESWSTIFPDIERLIMPGITHWQSPYMHAYFPALNSPASLLGDMLSDAIGCLGFTWASCPVATELEIIVMEWLRKMIGLPKWPSGGGVIQTTASEATLVAMLAARSDVLRKMGIEVFPRLVAYCSDQAHSSVEKAGLITLIQMRYIESDEYLSMRGDALEAAVLSDKEAGLIPFFVCATLGTTGACAFDNLREIGPICEANNIWIHVDAAYAGTAFICPEYRQYLEGVDYASSFAFNPSKWMMVNFDCTAMWVKYTASLHHAFNVDPLYLKHENSGHAVDFMHWQIPLSKKFRALKLWFVIRNFGIEGLQAHVRHGVKLARIFVDQVQRDRRFEIPAKNLLGMVVFRLKGDNELTEKLLKILNSEGKLHCVPASLKGIYVIRFTITSYRTTVEDVIRDWKIIQMTATMVIDMYRPKPGRAINLAATKKILPSFGTSLLLSNSPKTPKVVDGSFVAIFDSPELIEGFVKKFGDHFMERSENFSFRRRIKGLLLTDKQHSLDSKIDLMNSIVATINLQDHSNKKEPLKSLKTETLDENIAKEDESND